MAKKSVKRAEKVSKPTKPLSGRKTLMLCIALIILVFVSFFSYSYYVKVWKPKQYRYNGFDFHKGDLVWTTQVEVDGRLYAIPFYNHPKELETIVVEPGIENKIKRLNSSDKIFITIDPDLESRAVIAAVELSRITGSRYDIFNVPTQGALTRPSWKGKADSVNPVVTCANANNNTLVVWLKLGDVNAVHSSDNCLLLEGKTGEDLIRVADRFVYRLLGIMPS